LSSAPTQSFIPKNPARAKVNWQLVLAGNPNPKPLPQLPSANSARSLQQKLMTTFCVTLVQNPTVQDMINLQKLQNLATLQQQQQQQQQHPHPHHGHQHHHHHPATAAALASLQGLAASVFNSPLNLSVGGEPVATTGPSVAPTSPTHNGGKSKTAKGGSSGNGSGGSSANSGTSSAQQQQQPDNPSSSSSPHHPLSASSLANVLAAATASPPPSLQAPPASAQMPQLILASGQLVQGVQGAQLLIPTAQGECVLHGLSSLVCSSCSSSALSVCSSGYQ